VQVWVCLLCMRVSYCRGVHSKMYVTNYINYINVNSQEMRKNILRRTETYVFCSPMLNIRYLQLHIIP